MKKRFTFIILLLAAWLSSATAATIPAGKTIYFCPGVSWGCMATYVVYCSGWNPQGYQIFTPVPGTVGVYQCTLTTSVSSEIHFGATEQVLTSDGTGWIGNFCPNQYIHQTSQNGWTSSTPCYIIDDPSGSGHWGAVPEDSGGADVVIDSVVYNIVSSCVTETYNITVNAYFTGDACSYKLTGTEMSREVIRTSPVSPVTYVIKNIPAKQTQEQQSITFSLSADGSGSAIIATETVNYLTPTLDCEILHEPTEVCAGFPDVVLEATLEGDSYLWSTGETTRSISVPSDKSETYSVEVFSITRSSKDNLMANGDFESEPVGSNPPDGFTSSYDYAGTFDPSQFYNSHPGAANIYAITHNANYFWRDFADIEPHGGEFYAIFDAGKSGYAWRATTSDNTSLTVEKDSVYLFSYWAAYPNKKADNSPAILQFQISYVDPNGQPQTQKLGQRYKLGQEEDLNAWYHQMIEWTAPCNSTSVTISVEDLNSASGGNDFCLDDILFQRTTVGKSVLARKDIFPVVSTECDVLKDTICLGERYTEYGLDVTPTEAGISTYNVPGTQSILSLLVVAPVQASFKTPNPFCNFGGGEIELPFTVQQGTPYSYSLQCANPLIESVEKKQVEGNAIIVSVSDSIFEPAALHITLFDEFGTCSPFSADMTLTFQRCSYRMDTVCSGEPYSKDGFEHPADQPGSYILTQGTDTLLLTVIESLSVAIQTPAPLCNVHKDTTLVVTYSVTSGAPKTYSLHFDTPLMEDVEKAPLQGNQFSIFLPGTVDQTVQVTFYAEEETGHCAVENQFAIGRNAGVAIYSKWDDVLFVDNGRGEYVGYQWYCDGAAIPGATRQDYYTGSPLENDGHSYYVVLTRADGTTDVSCPMSFGDASPSAPLNPGDKKTTPYHVRRLIVGAHVEIVETIYEDGNIDVQKRIVP